MGDLIDFTNHLESRTLIDVSTAMTMWIFPPMCENIRTQHLQDCPAICVTSTCHNIYLTTCMLSHGGLLREEQKHLLRLLHLLSTLFPRTSNRLKRGVRSLYCAIAIVHMACE